MSGVWFLAGATAVGLILVGASVLRCLARSRRCRARPSTPVSPCGTRNGTPSRGQG